MIMEVGEDVIMEVGEDAVNAVAQPGWTNWGFHDVREVRTDFIHFPLVEISRNQDEWVIDLTICLGHTPRDNVQVSSSPCSLLVRGQVTSNNHHFS